MKRWLIVSIFILSIVLIIMVVNNIQTRSEQQSCENNGGKWESAGQVWGSYFCNNPTNDAGKFCTDSKECESGLCEAQTQEIGKIGSNGTGNCYGWINPVWACTLRIENGIVSPGICP